MAHLEVVGASLRQRVKQILDRSFLIVRVGEKFGLAEFKEDSGVLVNFVGTLKECNLEYLNECSRRS